MNKTENIRFWASLTAVMLAVSITVMLIDMSIKAAILQESAELKRMIDDRRTESPHDGRGSHGDDSDPLLAEHPAGMDDQDAL